MIYISCPGSWLTLLNQVQKKGNGHFPPICNIREWLGGGGGGIQETYLKIESQVMGEKLSSSEDSCKQGHIVVQPTFHQLKLVE